MAVLVSVHFASLDFAGPCSNFGMSFEITVHNLSRGSLAFYRSCAITVSDLKGSINEWLDVA